MKRLLVPLLALGLAKAAMAFVLFKNENGEPLRWRLDEPDPLVHPNVVNRETRAIRIHLAKNGWSDDNAESELNSIRSAAAQWQAVPGTILKFEEGELLEPGHQGGSQGHALGQGQAGTLRDYERWVRSSSKNTPSAPAPGGDEILSGPVRN